MTQRWTELIDLIHLGENPYTYFNEASYYTDPWNGWDSTHPWFAETIAEVKPTTIVEVGSFLGGSAIHMARTLRNMELNACVVCVDTWLAERVLWTTREWRPRLRHTNGRPEVYKSFLANVIAADLQEYIVPLPMDSVGGMRFLQSLGIAAQIVYIDASHEEGDVYRDVSHAFSRLLVPGGVMLMDDYAPDEPDFLDLVNDVDRFARERNLTLETKGRKARIRK